jgi:hypothetical protein
MKNIRYKDIAEFINKSEQQIKWYKSNNPDMLELLKLGALCKKNNLDTEKIKKLIELQSIIKESD